MVRVLCSFSLPSLPPFSFPLRCFICVLEEDSGMQLSTGRAGTSARCTCARTARRAPIAVSVGIQYRNPVHPTSKATFPTSTILVTNAYGSFVAERLARLEVLQLWPRGRVSINRGVLSPPLISLLFRLSPRIPSLPSLPSLRPPFALVSRPSSPSHCHPFPLSLPFIPAPAVLFCFHALLAAAGSTAS
ncbi:hypothetical protein DFH06DRAFT_629410 [Mycena polygramma]|nr:hypothetical protein DFH06DRAFT_629410 [Mycena polygramma]